MSADSSMQATSLSDDIELGAVCSQSWNMTISDTETAFLGKEYDTYMYLVDYETNGILADEKIPMGRFTCVKSKKSGGRVHDNDRPVVGIYRFRTVRSDRYP